MFELMDAGSQNAVIPARSPHTSGACWIVDGDASIGARVRRCSAPAPPMWSGW